MALPFHNLTDAENLTWIGESVAETVRETLAAEGVSFVSRTRRNRAFGTVGVPLYSTITQATVYQIAKECSAAYAVYGGFQVLEADNSAPEEATVRIAARVLYTARGVRSQEYLLEGPIRDLTALELKLAWQVLNEIQPGRLTEDAFLAKYRPVRLDAMEAYVRGLMSSSPETRHRLLAQAARLEPEFGAPHFELGLLAWGRKNYRAAAGWFAKVAQSSPEFARAQLMLGISLYELADYAGAHQAFQKSAASLPTPEVENNLGAAASRLRKASALGHFQKAVELSPGDPDVLFNLGYSLWRSRQFEAAAARFEEVLRLRPSDLQAADLLERCRKGAGPRPADDRSQGLERLKLPEAEAEPAAQPAP